MTCPHLEETSALFDGRSVDRAHADACDECRAFLADAAVLRAQLWSAAARPPLSKAEALPPHSIFRFAPVLVPAALVLGLVAALVLRNDVAEDSGPFAGLDGGGRAVIAVKDGR